MQDQTSWYTAKGSIAPMNELSSIARYVCFHPNKPRLTSSFVPRPLDIKLDAPERSGYLGEQIPVMLKIRNDDDRRIFMRLSVFLPPSDDEQGTSLRASALAPALTGRHFGQIRRG